MSRLCSFLRCRKADVFAGKLAFTRRNHLFILFGREVALYMQIEKNIAATLQSKMKEAGKTKLEFSKELGIPRSTLQGYLKGDKCLRSDSIEELARSLSVSPAQLISRPDYAKTFGLFSMTSLLAELQTLHPQAQALARDAVLLLEAAFRVSEEWNRLDALPTPSDEEGT
jgi:transcriptional regulator with XRE-family HTH domain